MNPFTEIGINTFQSALSEEIAKAPEGAVFRSGGRPTKAMPHGEDRQWWEANGPAMVASWLGWRNNNPNLHVWKTPDGSPAIEMGVVAQIDTPNGPVALKGYIDRVFEDATTKELLIVDLKSGKMTPPPLQLGFYRRALKATTGIEARYGAYWMAREGTLSSPVDLTTFTDEVVDYWVATTYAGIKANIFLPHVTQLCRGCGVKDSCYVFNPNAKFPPYNTHMTPGGNDVQH